jgi:hypothetical protein
MPEEIRSKLQEIRFRLRVLLWLGGVSALLAVLCGGVLLGAFLDRAIVGDSVSGRVMLTLGLCSAVIWVFRKELLTPLRNPLSDAWIARKIEAYYPDLRGSLASSVEFSAGGYSEQYGSRDLQQRSVSATVARILSLDTGPLLSHRPFLRRAIPSAALLLICLLIAAFRTEAAVAALERLAFPLRVVEWPRSVMLQIEDEHGTPLTEAELRGVTFPRGSLREYRVRNLKGDLPEDLKLELRTSDGRVQPAPIPRESEPQRDRLVGRIRLEMREPFAFRVSGGDDQTPWYEVQVVPPPVLKQLSLRIQPPEYTGQSAFELPAGASFVQAVVGSVLEIRGEADVPLSDAKLIEQGSQSHPVALTGGAGRFEGRYQIERLGATNLKLELTDEQGVINNSAVRMELVGLADQPPQVKFLAPGTDQMVTPEAANFVQLQAADDFGLVDLEVRFLKQGSDGEWELLLSRSLLEAGGSPRETQTSFEFSASDFGLNAGETLSLRAIARDFLSTEEERFGQDERQFTLVSPSRKQEELAGRLHEMIERLERERVNQGMVRENLAQLFQQTPDAGASEIPGLTTDQKMIEQRLTSDQQGLLSEIRKIEREARRNQLEHPVFEQQLQTLISDLELLDRIIFPSLNQMLARIEPGHLGGDAAPRELPQLPDPVDPLLLNKLLEQTPEADRGRLLQQLIESRQKQVEEILGDLTGAIDEWREGQSLKNALGRMLETQKGIDRDAKQLHARTLGKKLSELSPAQREQLRELATAQQGNRQQLARFAQQLRQESSQGAAPSHLSDLTEAIEQSTAAAAMGELEREFRDNLLGQAVQRNQDLLAELQQWDDLLHNRPVTDAELKMQLLDKQQQALSELQTRQQKLDREVRTEATRDGLPEDRREERSAAQRRIERDAGRIERNFERLQLSEPRRHLSDARREMNESADQLAAGQIPDEPFRETEQHLEQAARSAERERSRLRGEHERELAADLLPRLRELHRAEAELLADSAKLQAEQTRAERWTRPLLRDLKLAQQIQQNLREQLTQLAEPLKSIEAIGLALNHVGELMDRTVAGFEDRNLNAVTQRHLPGTLEQLQVIISVLEQAAVRQNAAAGSQQAGSESSSDSESDAEDENLMLQLTLLRAVQEQIHRRMARLDRREPETGPSEEIREEWRQVQSDQQRVEEILQDGHDRLTQAQLVAGVESRQLERLVDTSEDLLDEIDLHRGDIEQQTVTRETRSRQSEILRLWDSLLDAAGEQAAAQSGSQPPPEPDPASDRNAQDQSPENQQRQSDPDSPSDSLDEESPRVTESPAEGERREDDPEQAADRSTELTRAREEAIRAANLLRQEERRRLMQDVWGQLPPQLREKLMNASDEEYLPEYRENIREYFRSLSDPSGNSSPR